MTFFLWLQKLGPISTFCHLQNELGVAPSLYFWVLVTFHLFSQGQGEMAASRSHYLSLILCEPFVLALSQFFINQIPYIKYLSLNV